MRGLHKSLSIGNILGNPVLEVISEVQPCPFNTYFLGLGAGTLMGLTQNDNSSIIIHNINKKLKILFSRAQYIISYLMITRVKNHINKLIYTKECFTMKCHG